MDNAKVEKLFIDALTKAALETLKVQCSCEVKPGTPWRSEDRKGKALEIDIVAVVAATSKSMNGAVALCFPESTFLAAMGGMFGETYTSISKELQDGAGELLNIIFGAVRKSLNGTIEGMESAIPSTIVGDNLRVRYLPADSTVVIPFESKAGKFQIEFALQREVAAKREAA